MDDLFNRPPDLETPKVRIWSHDLPAGIEPASASLTIEFETEEPFETRVYDVDNEPRLRGWAFKILSKVRKNDGQVWWSTKLQDHRKQTVYESAASDWITEAQFRNVIGVLLTDTLRALQLAFPDATLGEPLVTDGKSMLRMWQEARR